MSDVERIRGELLSLREIVGRSKSLSDVNAFESLAAKTLLLAAASFFEKKICEAILACAKNTGTHDIFANFIEKQALERKFHSMFQWEATNINRFLALFGTENKKIMEDEIKVSEQLSSAMNDFIYINSQRNLLVHNNFAAFNLDAAMDDIWLKFGSAKRLSDWLPEKLTELASEGPEAIARQADT
jgi:hypothetical protein